MRLPALLVAGVAALLMASPAHAQDPPPRIGPFVFDLHATVPMFPSDNPGLQESRTLVTGELPGAGLGLHGGAHAYVLTWKALTVGVGVDMTVARTRQGAVPLSETAQSRPVTETFSHIAPELSFNFGDGDGWSYLSAGVGPSVWQFDVAGRDQVSADTERLQTTNWGGGARWFIKPRLAFSLDVRFYTVNPSTPDLRDPGLPTQPRTRLLIIGAGVSFK
ncbi:MAG: hypothetical protein ABL961_05415 [Vicinamibacterales bacterium]